ncbi:MAG: hypothetical protein KGR26_16175, partial [Cyanobacteria bacterium REEB65]|nr:hypothetical protein [Cyanobacteria bacterium REEB65]
KKFGVPERPPAPSQSKSATTEEQLAAERKAIEDEKQLRDQIRKARHDALMRELRELTGEGVGAEGVAEQLAVMPREVQSKLQAVRAGFLEAVTATKGFFGGASSQEAAFGDAAKPESVITEAIRQVGNQQGQKLDAIKTAVTDLPGQLGGLVVT